MSETAVAAKGPKRKKKSSRQSEHFLSSLEFKHLFYYVVFPLAIALVAIYAYVLTSSMQSEEESAKGQSLSHKDFTAKSPPVLSADYSILKHGIDEIEWSDAPGFLETVVERARPTLLKNSPVQNWSACQWDLGALAASGLLLNGSRLQSDPVFVLGHDRDKGGMLGKEADLNVSYVNVYLKDFLASVFDKDTFMYWTGPSDVFEQFEAEKQAAGAMPRSIGAWEALRVAESSVNISLEETSLWMPMIWLSHPGVTAHTHYDTQHNFFAQILGRKKLLIFELSSELYLFPNIHRSYRQSQLRLEHSASGNERPASERFPLSRRLNAAEVSVSPGDLLYIPPYWAHRVESETLSMSVSVLSPSATEVALAEAFWTKVPFGPFEQGDNIFRSGAVKLLLYYIVGLGDVLLDLSLETFAADLLHSRFMDLYPLNSLKKLKADRKFMCPSMGDENLTKLLEDNAQKFYDAALEITALVNDLNVHRTIKENFYRDYAEQVIRWAVGPDAVPLFLKYCLK